MNARKEAGLVNPVTKEYLELDVFLPSLNLAFEFHVPMIPLTRVIEVCFRRSGIIMLARNMQIGQ